MGRKNHVSGGVYMGGVWILVTFFLINPSRATRGHVYKLFVQQSRIDVRKYFFCNRVVKIWNSLPATTEDFASIGMLKGLINRVDLSQYVNFGCMQDDVLAKVFIFFFLLFLRATAYML